MHRRHEHHGAAARSRTHHDVGHAGGRGRVRARAVDGRACAPTSSRCTSPSPRARRSPSTAPSCAGRTGRCALGFNYREGPVHLPGGLRRPRRPSATSPTGCRSPRWSCPTATPRFDHYRRTAYDIGEWGLGFMTTSLELGCDCLGEIVYLDAVLHDTHGRAVRRSRTRSASTRRTTPCCGSTSTATTGAEVRRHAPDGGLVPRHRRQLRVPRLLALLPGRQHRVRGPRHRHHGDHAVSPRARPRRPTAPSSTTAPTRRSTSTSWSPGSTSTSTATTNTVDGGRLGRPAGVRRTTPTAWRWSPQSTPIALRGRVGPRLQLGHPARLEGGQPEQAQPARHQRRLQAGARRARSRR